MSVADAWAVRRESPGRYAATVLPGWDIAGATDGGYLLAITAQAVLAETRRADPLTMTAHYLEPARPGPVVVEVQTLRSGRRRTAAAARLTSGEGRLLLSSLAVVGEQVGACEQAPLVSDGSPPALPPPEQCVPVEPTPTFPPPFMGRVRLRLHPEDAGVFTGRPSGTALIRGWFALPEHEPLSSTAVLLAADSFPPPVFNADLPVSWTPTVELTVHVRARPVGAWLACAFRTRFVSGGYLEVDGELWDSAGGLVALSRQLALVPRG